MNTLTSTNEEVKKHEKASFLGDGYGGLGNGK